MSKWNTNCAMLPALGCLSELPSFSVGSLVGLGVWGGPGPCPAALQRTRKPGSGATSFGSTCITACVIDSKEHSSAATAWLKGKMWGRLILAVKSQDMTLPLRHPCSYSFQCFYFCDINLRKRLGSSILCLPASYWSQCCSFPGAGCPSMTALLTRAKQAVAPTPHHMHMWLCMYTGIHDI